MIRRLAVLSSLLCLFSVVATGTTWLLLRAPTGGAEPATVAGPGAATSAEPSVDTPGMRARAVLAGWDADRASAWAAGDVDELRSLYVPGSRTGEEDARMLERWRSRGVRVTGMTTQVHSLEVLRSSPRRWRVRVTDRMVGAVAVGPGTSHRLPLPTDGWTERTIDLRRSSGRWLVLEVRRSAGS